MIGVITTDSQQPVVREFFELFKTPWEFYRSGWHYDVVLCAGPDVVEDSSAKLVVIYGGRELPFDAAQGRYGHPHAPGPRMFVAEGRRIAVYGESVTFSPSRSGLLVDEVSQHPAAYMEVRARGPVVVRIGYDLLTEIAFLLSEGQPVDNAGIPSIDLHISLLRSLILCHGIPLVEIPPVPRGYRFIACLTHDVDHPAIRLHKFDHTMMGFLYRAIIGSPWAFLRGRFSMRAWFRNWMAVLRLPLVFLGVLPDFWNEFEAYRTLEGGAVRSSFFVIPFKRYRGTGNGGLPPKKRASAYAAADLAGKIRQLLAAGHEIGLHGIDAWHDEKSGRRELNEVNHVSGTKITGVRMHWLYFDRQSPGLLDRLGFDYDSTVGYNDTIGYRAGASQVYRPLDAQRLLELPLHVMDTALFFPGCMNLSPAEARRAVGKLIDHAARFGGVITINWHDRSLAPERMWDDFYVDLLDELRSRGAWLANARDTVRWFRKRRAAGFDDRDRIKEDANGCIEPNQDLPGTELRVHNPRPSVSVFEPADA
jgi:peptidoglycan/xylan/chitin deacetylase (PgdA/CDA1 family)